MKFSSSIDFSDISGLTLRYVKYLHSIIYDDGGTGYDKIIFDFGRLKVLVQVNDNTDEIELSFVEGISEDGWSEIESFRKYVGQEFSWGWIARNSQGYQDFIAISFEAPIPNVMMLSSASMLNIYEICPT